MDRSLCGGHGEIVGAQRVLRRRQQRERHAFEPNISSIEDMLVVAGGRSIGDMARWIAHAMSMMRRVK